MRKLLLTTVAAGALLVVLNGAEAQRMNEPGGSQSPGVSDQAPRAGERAPAGERGERTQRRERAPSERAMERRDGAAQQERQQERGTAQQERRGQQPDRADQARERERSGQRERARQDGAEERRRGQAERRDRARDGDPTRERRSRADRERDRDRSVERDRTRDRNRSVERERDRRNAAQDRERRMDDRRGDRADRADRNRNRSRVNLTSEDRVRVSRTFENTIERRNIRPLRDVRFSVSVGTRVPRNVRLYDVPVEIVRIHPEFRSYRFVVVEDQVVIVEPRSFEIVSVLPLSGSTTVATRVRSDNVGRADARALDLTVEQRRVIRERVVEAPICRDELRLDFGIGIPLPRTVKICEFPREVVTEVPAIRSYRYVVRGDDVVIVDPDEHRVIEVIE